MEPEPSPTSSSYRPEFAEEARKLTLMGITDEALARHFGIPPATLHKWLASEPEFARAVRYGRTLGDAEVVDRFHQNALGFSHEAVKPPSGQEKEARTYIRHRPPNRHARDFWVMNRRPGEWSRKVEMEAEPRPGWARELTRAELERLIAEPRICNGWVS